MPKPKSLAFFHFVFWEKFVINKADVNLNMIGFYSSFNWNLYYVICKISARTHLSALLTPHQISCLYLSSHIFKRTITEFLSTVQLLSYSSLVPSSNDLSYKPRVTPSLLCWLFISVLCCNTQYQRQWRYPATPCIMWVPQSTLEYNWFSWTVSRVHVLHIQRK